MEEERFGEMVTYNPPQIGSIPITQAIHRLSTVDPQGSAVVAAKALGIAFGDTPGYTNPFPQSHVLAKAEAEKYNQTSMSSGL